MKPTVPFLILGLLLHTATGAFAQQGRPSDEQIAEWRAKKAAREAAGETSESPGKPSEAQIADWRAKREAREAATAIPPAPSAAPMAEHQHGANAGSGKPAASTPGGSTKPDESAHSSGRPSGTPPGMRGGGNALWLSDSPPSRGDGPPRGNMGGMGGMAMGGGERNGPPVKRLWLRAGADPQKSGFARDDAEATVETLLVKPQGKTEGEPLPPANDGKRNLSFEMPVQGYYRLYITTRKVQGDTLNVSVAKSEITNFSHGGDEEERSRAMTSVRVLESAPIEIVRERRPDEKLFFQLKSGEEQAFVVLQKGLPLQGARVRLVSHNGWSKEATSDEQGRVSFQIIRDYFPAWDDFQKRFKATYLVIAEANAAENGSFKDQPYSNVRYQATLSGSYYPSPDDYRSYAWGLGIGFGFLLFCGGAIYLYRRRRVKPFQEVRFDEKH
jgi:hypothetical protein